MIKTVRESISVGYFIKNTKDGRMYLECSSSISCKENYNCGFYRDVMRSEALVHNPKGSLADRATAW
jgi:hypothetical protein